MRPKDAIPDAPVYTATLAEMENLEELLARANEIAMKYGAVRIDPPSTWPRPPLRMAPKSRFFVRMQTLPAAPFADPNIVNHANAAKNHPRKRGRRNTLTPCYGDSDDPAPELKQQKTTGRDRAARAASRSQRNHLKPPEQDKQALLDHLASADFHSERTPRNIPFESPPNPHCTPVPSPPPELRGTEHPAIPTQKPQSFARPSSREPSAKPSGTSSGQTQAVREAALRLAEAFTGPAKAGPVQNATAIPPCPFSQQTAQEHIAKRTAEDQDQCPLQKALPINLPAQLTLVAPTTQVGTGRVRNPLAVASACGIAGGSVGVQPRAAGNKVGTNTMNKPQATALLNNQAISLKATTVTREPVRKDWSRPAFERYVEGKNDEALLLDNTRIPRINSKSASPFATAKHISLRTPWVLPRSAESFPKNAGNAPAGSPQNSANNVLSAFSSGQPLVRNEPPVNDRTTPSTYQNGREPGFVSMNVSQTGNRAWPPPSPSTSRNVCAIEREGHNSSVQQPESFPILRSVPLQSYGSRTPDLTSVVAGHEIDPRHGILPHGMNTAIQQQQVLQQTLGMTAQDGTDRGVATSVPSPILDVISAAEKPRNDDRDELLRETTPEEKAAFCERKEMEYPKAGSRAKVAPVMSSEDHLKTERNNSGDDLRKHEQKQMSEKPFDDPMQRSTTLNTNDKLTQNQRLVSVTNVVTPLHETKEISSSMTSKILTRVHTGSTAHSLTSKSVSHTSTRFESSPVIPKPRTGATVLGADRKNIWNPSHDIVEEILATATRIVDTEPLRIQQQTREDDVHPGNFVTVPPDPEQASTEEVPRNQPTDARVSKSTSGTSILYERTPRSCGDHRCQFEGVTQVQEEPVALDSQAHAASSHPIKLAACAQQHPQERAITGFLSGRPLPTVLKEESVAVPERKPHDSAGYKQALSGKTLITNTETVDDIVFVSERTKGQQRGNPSLHRSKPEDVIHLDEEKPPISASKPTGKRTAKRKTGFKNLQVDQDEVGRLTKAIVFPDSGMPISLALYEKKAQEHHDETRQALNSTEDETMCTSNVENALPKLDMRDVDTLEAEFWKAMSGGIRGRPVTVAYGVDVEAEGAFDSNEMSYVEWHGAEPAGSTTKKRKRGRPRIHKRPKPENKQEPVEDTKSQPNTDPPKTLRDELHEDADDEMDYNDNNSIQRSKLHFQMENFKSNPRNHKPKRLKPSLPRSHVGTLNRDGLLRHMPRMPGINHSMYYVGQLFTRFCWHTEDAFLNSVSYLHPGSAEKVWYAVPPEFAAAFEEFAASSVFSPSLLDSENAGRVLLMNKTTMFDPRRVRRKGVAVYRVVHKPGSFVLTAPRAYHAGFNCGFNIAEAVNFANPTWFPVGREASLFARKAIRPLCVPWEYLLFHEAKSLRDISNGVSKKTPSLHRLQTNARVVAKEFKAIVIDGEQKIWKYAEAQNCRVSMLHEVSGLAKHNQLGPEFGNGAGMVCSLCSHSCHFYAEMCGSCDDTFEARCVDHFGKGHRLCLHESHKTVIVRRHDPVLLLDILGCLERLAGIQVDAQEIAHRYVGYLRTWQTPLKASGLRLRLDLKAATSRLPPKVSKDKHDREKVAKAKIVRDKTHREKRRKIRKPTGSFARAGEKVKRGLHTKAEILGGIDVFTAVETKDGMESDGGRGSRRVFESIRDTMGKIPLF